MYQLIKNYCENSYSNGLFLLDMPTGFGKTYSVLKYIFEACQLEENKKRRFFFITPLKKNLPIKKNNLSAGEMLDELKKFFEDAEKLTEFQEKFLFIDSNSESVLTGYTDALEKTIPEEIRKTEEYKNFRQEVVFLQKRRNTTDYQIRQMVNGIENSFRERTEPAFRKMISKILHKKYDSVRKRIRAIKTEDEWKWVGKLYPAVFTQDRQIIFMSMDKFLLKNATIVEPSYMFCNNKIINNAVIFIDEFDSTKETMLKNIIQSGLRHKIDVIELFRSIYAAMETNDFPADLTTSSEQRKNSEYSSQSLEGVLADARKKAQKIYTSYALQFSHRTIEDTTDSYRNFMFQDHKSYSIVNGDKRYIISVTNEKKRINEIYFKYKKSELETENINVMLSSLRGFIGWFQGTVNILAHNYRQLKNERRKSGEDEFTQEQAIWTVLSLFHLSQHEIEYLITPIIMASRGNKNDQISDIEFDRTVYENGFRYYSFENDPKHDMQSKIMMYSFQSTPEKLLLRFCERAKVIGISATATVPTVIGNFNLEYLHSRMQDTFYEMPKSEHQRLEQDFCKHQSGYQNIKIHTQLIGVEKYSLQTWLDILDDKELAEHIYNLLERSVSKGQGKNPYYNHERYVRIATAFKAFMEHRDIQSMLCLLTKHPVKNDNALDSNLLEEIFNIIAGDNREWYVKYLNSQEYDSKKDDIISLLKVRKRVFVISTYQTIGAGQNLQYEIPSELQRKLICSNDLPPRNEKDFDAIYLDKPTNLIVNMESNWQEENFVKYLFQMEFLQENAELSTLNTSKHIKKAFQCYMQEKVPTEYIENLHNKRSVRMYATRTIIQAIGRICRTNRKNPNIYIFADERIADVFDISVTQGRILNHECIALIEKIAEIQKEVPVSDSLENKANLVSNRAGRDIDFILSNSWTKNGMEKWQELRKIVLCLPTASECDADRSFIIANYYVKFPQKSNFLYYAQEDDFRDIKVSLTKNQQIRCIENESNTRLDRLMQWQPLYNYFQTQGYATSFVPNDYIMSPAIWNNIYKGALGEVTGLFWFEQMLGITLEEITEPETFELFDFKLPQKSVYVDFKNWDETTEMDWRDTVDKVKNKAEKCNCKCVIIANILTQREHKIQKFKEEDVEFLIVPSLLRDNGSIMIDNEAVNTIRRCLNDYTN